MSTPTQYFLRSESGDITEIDKDLLVGRSEACDLIITEGHPSRKHARITLEGADEDRDVYVEDLGSANGTFINKKRIQDKQKLRNGDTLALGLYKLDFYLEGGVSSAETTEVKLVDADQTVVHQGLSDVTGPPKRFGLLGEHLEEIISFDETIVVGRATNGDRQVDLIIENVGVSSVHAELEPSADGVFVTDLDSSNGTYVNDKRITERTFAEKDDRLRFHLVEVVLSDRNPPAPQPAEPSADDDTSDGEKNKSNPLDPISEENSYLELEDNAEKGGTVMMPIGAAVPPAWLEDSGAGTVVVNPAELKKLNAANAEENEENDVARLEETVDAPTLLILSGSEAGRPYKLQTAGEFNYWNIGRDSSQHDLSIVIDDPSVSDFHAKLICRNARWQVIDQMSTNSVYVNGNRHSSAYLSSTDRVRIGRVETMLLLPRTPNPQPENKSQSWYSRILAWLGIQ